jgi:hypothetical protein
VVQSYNLYGNAWMHDLLFVLTYSLYAEYSVFRLPTHGVASVDMEITIYESILRLVDQMMTLFSVEIKRNAAIELNKIISGGVMGVHKSTSCSWWDISTGETA